MAVDHILVVEGSDSIRFLLVRTFEAAGFRVSEASDAPAAAEAVSLDPPDLVLLDQNLRHGAGGELLARWRASARSFPVIVMSALTTDDAMNGAFRAGASDFVCKPFSPLELVERVRTQLSPVSLSA